MPAVELKRTRKRMPATNDEAIPIRIVSPIDIGSGPGRARRPRPPTMAPQTSRNRMKPIMGASLVGRGSTGKGAAPAPGDVQRRAAEQEEREDQPGHDPQHHPEEDAQRQPGDDAGADRLADAPVLLPGEDRPDHRPEDGTLDAQADDEADHGTSSADPT